MPGREPISSQSPIADADLVVRAVEGDSAAWQELYDRVIGFVWREALRSVANQSAAEEIVAESMLAFVKSLHTIDPSNFRLYGWMRAIVRSKVSDWARCQGRQSKAFQELRKTTPDADHAQPEEKSLAGESRQLIYEVLDSMREEYRDTLHMKYLEGLSVIEIAARTDMTPKTVESRLFRARKKFRERYEARQKDLETATVLPPFPAT